MFRTGPNEATFGDDSVRQIILSLLLTFLLCLEKHGSVELRHVTCCIGPIFFSALKSPPCEYETLVCDVITRYVWKFGRRICKCSDGHKKCGETNRRKSQGKNIFLGAFQYSSHHQPTIQQHTDHTSVPLVFWSTGCSLKMIQAKPKRVGA